VHGRTRLLALFLTLACCLPSTAAAAPIPAGTYDVSIGQGTVDIGAELLPALTLNGGTSFTVPIANQPVSQPIGLTVTELPISGAVSGTASVTVTGAGVTIDPSDGSASLDASFYVTVTLSNGIASGSCSLGSSGSPIAVHLSTDNGSAWDPATGGFSMADKTFVLPAPSCSPSLLGALLDTLLGSTTSPGDNLISIVGTALRQPDPITPITNPTTTSATGPIGGGATTQTTTTTTAGQSPAPAAKACVVPKLVGKTLKQAKRALKKAGCKTGKAKSKKSKKKKGRILKQGKKAGTRLPAGATVPITVSGGPKKTRKQRSR
jgi:hypothetical protein